MYLKTDLLTVFVTSSVEDAMADLWSDLQGTHGNCRVHWVVACGLGGWGVRGVCVLQIEIMCKSRQPVGEWTEKIGIEGKGRKQWKE